MFDILWKIVGVTALVTGASLFSILDRVSPGWRQKTANIVNPEFIRWGLIVIGLAIVVAAYAVPWARDAVANEKPTDTLFQLQREGVILRSDWCLVFPDPTSSYGPRWDEEGSHDVGDWSRRVRMFLDEKYPQYATQFPPIEPFNRFELMGRKSVCEHLERDLTMLADIYEKERP